MLYLHYSNIYKSFLPYLGDYIHTHTHVLWALSKDIPIFFLLGLTEFMTYLQATNFLFRNELSRPHIS
jgi:hypothetical protein